MKKLPKDIKVRLEELIVNASEVAEMVQEARDQGQDDPIRERLKATGTPWVIENVVGAPLRVDLMLCAAAFGLRSYRHRIFEASFPMEQPPHPEHVTRVNRRKTNRRAHWDAGGFVTVTGDIGSYVGPEAMGIDWMTGAELSQAIPPAYSYYIGRQALLAILGATGAA